MARTKLSVEEKAQRKRDQMIEDATRFSSGTYIRRYVAPNFQRVIRAEAAAMPACGVVVIVNGDLDTVFRSVGQCACVTCGKVLAWDSGIKGMHTGHFLASRCNSILFQEENVAPQCSHCNYFRDGEQQLFRKWMLAVRGLPVIERLERLKNTTRQFTRDELVDMRIAYAARLKAAEAIISPSP